ncbi:hypothetical protein THIOSC15_2940006 [uncultured Thiomicrorhabdus sp.]
MKEELKSNYIIRIRNSTYRKTFFVLALIGIILLTSVIFPLHQLLRGEQEKNFSHLMNDKAVAVEQYVSKIMDISDQITSRSAIRNQLSLYNQGKISLEEMVNFSKPKLNDAITYSDGIEGITRLDIKGEVVLTLGENIPESVIRTSSLHSEKISVQNPISINNQLKIIVIAPIFDRNNNKLGVDIVLFNSDELRNIIKNYDNLGETGDASLIYPTSQNPFTHFFEPRRPHSHLGLAELIGQFHPTSSVEEHTLPVLENYVITFRSVKNTDWFMFLRMQQDEFYRVVNQTILTLSVVAFTIILICKLGGFKIIDPVVQLPSKTRKT